MATGRLPPLSSSNRPAGGSQSSDGSLSSNGTKGSASLGSSRGSLILGPKAVVQALSTPQRVLCVLVTLSVAFVTVLSVVVLLDASEDLRALQERAVVQALVQRVSDGVERQTRSTQTLVATLNRQMGAHYSKPNASHISVDLAAVFDSTLAALTIDQGDVAVSNAVSEPSVLLLGFAPRVTHSERGFFEAQLSSELNATRGIVRSSPDGPGVVAAPNAANYAPITMTRPPLLAGFEGLDLRASAGLPKLLDDLHAQLELVSWSNGAYHLGVLPAYRPPDAVAVAMTNLGTPSPGVAWPSSPPTRGERDERLVGWSYLVMNVSVAVEAATRGAEALLPTEAQLATVDYSVVDAQSVIRAAQLAGETPPEPGAVCSTDREAGVHTVFESIGHVSSEPLCFVCGNDDVAASTDAGSNDHDDYYEWVNACATLKAGGSTFIFRGRARLGSFLPVDEPARVAAIGIPVAVAVAILLLVVGILGNMVSSQRARLEHNKRIAAVELQMGFESTMSYACHELRNPLHVASSCLEFVMEYMDSLAPEVREDLTNMASAIAAMRMLVDDILDVSKLRTGAVSVVRAAANIRTIATRAVDEHRTFAVVPIVCSIDPAVPSIAVTDGMRLRQILANGISNAAKHTTRGQIHMQVRVRRLEDVLDLLVHAGHVPASALSDPSGLSPRVRRMISAGARSSRSPTHGAASAARMHDSARMPRSHGKAPPTGADAGQPQRALIRLSEQYVEFKVSDTGLGLQGEDPELLFQPYRQGVTHAEAPLGASKKKKKARGGESATGLEDRAMRGTGLGLSICRMLARALGGEATLGDRIAAPVAADSGISGGAPAEPVVEGADFTVIIPLETAKEDFPIRRSGPSFESPHSVAEALHSPAATQTADRESTRAAVHEGHEGLPYHVIIVDDMRANRRLGMRMAESLGWSCAVLEDGDEVLDYLRSHHRHVLKADPEGPDHEVPPTAGTGAPAGISTGTTAPSASAGSTDGAAESKTADSDAAPTSASEVAVDIADTAHTGAAATATTARSSGAAAPDPAQRPLHAILLDIVMARQSGVATCKQLRSCGVELPVIAATGNAASSDVQTYIAAGFNAVLHKPFNRVALQRVVAELVSGVSET